MIQWCVCAELLFLFAPSLGIDAVIVVLSLALLHSLHNHYIPLSIALVASEPAEASFYTATYVYCQLDDHQS